MTIALRFSYCSKCPYSPSLLLLAKPRSCDASNVGERDARFFDARDEHQPRQTPCRWRGQYPDGAGLQRCPTLKKAFLHENHYSITSSARASRVVGALRPMPLRGGRLILEESTRTGNARSCGWQCLQASWVDRLSALGASTICALGYSL